MKRSNATPYNYRDAAQRLVDTHQATDFSHACSLLARRRRKPLVRPTQSNHPTKIRLPYADN